MEFNWTLATGALVAIYAISAKHSIEVRRCEKDETVAATRANATVEASKNNVAVQQCPTTVVNYKDFF